MESVCSLSSTQRITFFGRMRIRSLFQTGHGDVRWFRVSSGAGRRSAGWPEARAAQGLRKISAAVRLHREASEGACLREPSNLDKRRRSKALPSAFQARMGPGSSAGSGLEDEAEPRVRERPDTGQVATRAGTQGIEPLRGQPGARTHAPAVHEDMRGRRRGRARLQCRRRRCAREPRLRAVRPLSVQLSVTQAKALVFRGLAGGPNHRAASPLRQRFPTLRGGTRVGNWRRAGEEAQESRLLIHRIPNLCLFVAV